MIKYWLNGAPTITVENNDSGTMKYWNNGSPLIVGTASAAGEISVADKVWTSIKKIGGVIISVIKKIGGVEP